MFQIISNKAKLHGTANSMQGGRRENQDDLGFIDTPLGFLFVVCDGMGGGPGGKTASAIAKQEIARQLSSCNLLTPRKQALRIAVAKANDALTEAMMSNKELRGMGTTVVALLVNEYSAIVCHAGDSRCYRLHGRFQLFRTEDHSLVGELVRKKVLTEEEARTSPQSNVIAKSLGSKTDHNPDITEMGYMKGDRFILCTDGVWGSMPHKSLMKLFTAKGNTVNVVARISGEVEKAGIAKGGGHDNHTVAVIVMDDSSKLHDKWYKRFCGAVATLIAIMAIIITVCIAGSDNSKPAAASGNGGSYTTTTPVKELATPAAKDEKPDKGDTDKNAVKIDGKMYSGKEGSTDEKADGESVTDNTEKDSAAKEGKTESKGSSDIKAAIEKALTALKNMEGYHNENAEKTKSEKALHAEKVIKCLENVRQQCGKKDEATANGILDYAKRNKKAMAGVAKPKDSGRYGSDNTAKEIMQKIRAKLKELEKAKE